VSTEFHESRDKDEKGLVGGKSVSRREFLKIAGIAGATVGVGAGLGGLVAACGGTTTTTAAPTTAAPGSTTTSTAAAGSTTTASAGPVQGREVKIGAVSPVTGALAAFGGTEAWSAKLTAETLGAGIVLGDGQLHKITIITKDSQSDTNRAAQVAGDLISNDKVDMLVSSGTPDTVNPAADQAEALGCPFVSCFNPWQAFIFGRGATVTTEYKWIYGFYFGVDQEVVTESMAYDKLGTNKSIGFLFANDTDGNVWAQILPPAFEKMGYKVTFPQQYQPMTEDFSSQISAFKKAGVEIVSSTPIPPDLSNFWKQSVQQGLNLKAMFTGKAFVNTTVADAIGPTAEGMMGSSAFHRNFPYKDELTGLTATELCDRYEKDTGLEWAQTIGTHAKFTWAIDVLKRAKNIDDKQTIADAIRATKMQLITGNVDFTAPVDMAGVHITPNVCKQGWANTQIVKGANTKPNPSKWGFDQNIVGADSLPGVEVVDPIALTYGK